jgi:predicted site-specific integrase-resolvase
MADPRTESGDLMTPSDVAKRLQVADVTLRKWRLSGRGPLFVRCGSRVRYRPAHVEKWVDQRTAASTSTPALAPPDDGGAQ